MLWGKRKKEESPGFLLFGLGNPGREYTHTRHNVGWWVLDELQRRHGSQKTLHKSQGQADYLKMRGPEGMITVALIKPTTFMNRSGQCLKRWLTESPEVPFAVVYDEIDLPPGKLRLRDKGSAGGHNGMKSIIGALGTDEIVRLRVGVGRPPTGSDSADHVLDAPDKDERALIEGAVKEAADLLEELIAGGFDAAMQRKSQQGNPP